MDIQKPQSSPEGTVIIPGRGKAREPGAPPVSADSSSQPTLVGGVSPVPEPAPDSTAQPTVVVSGAGKASTQAESTAIPEQETELSGVPTPPVSFQPTAPLPLAFQPAEPPPPPPPMPEQLARSGGMNKTLIITIAILLLLCCCCLALVGLSYLIVQSGQSPASVSLLLPL